MAVIQAPQLSACPKGQEAAARRYRVAVFFANRLYFENTIQSFQAGEPVVLSQDELYYQHVIRYIFRLTKDWRVMREIYNLCFILDGKDFEFNLDYFTAVFENLVEHGLIEKSTMVTSNGRIDAYKCKELVMST